MVGKEPWGLRWRSNTLFIVSTVAVGLFTDLFLYGLIVPVIPYLLRQRIGTPRHQVQGYTSGLLAAYAGASVVFSFPAGILADRTKTRQAPFLCGLFALLGATVMLAVGQSIAVLVVARILQGTSGAVVWTIGLAMVLDTVGSNDLGKTIGSIFSFISVGELMAPVLGGVLYDKTGYVGVFGIGVGMLTVDFIMRILVIEKKTAAKYDSSLGKTNGNSGNGNADSHEEEASEEDALLPGSNQKQFRIPEPDNQHKFVKNVPIAYCLSDPRLLVALLLAFVQAFLLASFDATVPIQAQNLFGFPSLKAGLLFIALGVPSLLLGPVAGWVVDKYGTKPVAVFGFGYLVPVLLLLRLPQEGGAKQVIIYSVLLALCGIGMACIGSPSIVEAGTLVQKYDKANPGFFGENGPYAQLYGMNSLIFNAGLTIGPIVSGGLTDSVGYGNMNIALAALSGVTAVLSYFYIGGKPKWLGR